MATVLFHVAVVFCLYTYIVFPLILHVLARLRTKARDSLAAGSAVPSLEPGNSRQPLPTISVVIAVYNEEASLHRKIASLDALTYPPHLMQCIFVSDGSTDGSVTILNQACASKADWQVLVSEQAAGKPTALNRGVSTATGEILVFMDARQSVSSSALEVMTKRLSDNDVGVVSGELVLGNAGGGDAREVGLYWRYEKWIRANESALYSTTGATGALYAIRREHYLPLPANTILDDFEIPVVLLKRGLRTVCESAARVYDEAESDSGREFLRKVRTLSGNYQSFIRHRWLFSPRENPVWWQFISHKVFRLLVPYAMMLAFVTSVIADSLYLQTMALLQVVFYLTGLAAMLGWKNRLANTVKVFIQMNAAAVVGAWRAFSRRTDVRWRSS
ncbi:MAG: glycosyltransferase family 2 protein [Granulosicoccus sp.]